MLQLQQFYCLLRCDLYQRFDCICHTWWMGTCIPQGRISNTYTIPFCSKFRKHSYSLMFPKRNSARQGVEVIFWTWSLWKESIDLSEFRETKSNFQLNFVWMIRLEQQSITFDRKPHAGVETGHCYNPALLNTWRQNGCHLADDIFKCIFLNVKCMNFA